MRCCLQAALRTKRQQVVPRTCSVRTKLSVQGIYLRHRVRIVKLPPSVRCGPHLDLATAPSENGSVPKGEPPP
jgi:hypothetical protein